MKVDLIAHATAPESVKPLLDQVEQTYGFVPNTYGVMAHAPLAVVAYLQLNALIKEHSTLTPQEQQVVMLSISAENGCEYWVAAHTVVAGMVRAPADAAQAIRKGSTPSDSRLADLALRLDIALVIRRLRIGKHLLQGLPVEPFF